MAKEISALAAVVVFLLLCRYSSAQGGCSPAPPNTLISGGPSGALRSNNVPNILTQFLPSTTIFRVVVGPQGAAPWAVFSETQVRQHGLWCQVQQSNTNNMADSDIGDWYYPTPSGLHNINNDDTPYQELKCNNQVGLVVDGDIMNNQGIVRCTTTITGLTTLTGLSIDTNYVGVYEDSVINTIRNSGPVVESTMTLTLLHTRDVGPNVQFRLSFNVSRGLPSSITCTRDGTIIHNNRGYVPGVNYEVVRPLYASSSQPEITRVSFEETRPRIGATYICTVYVEGRKNIASATSYDFDELSSATSTAPVTVAGTPNSVTVIRNGYNSVLVSWTAPSPAPAGYEVFHQTTSDDTRLSVGNTTSTMMTVTGLTLGVTYYIFVVSFGAEGTPVLPSAHSTLNQTLQLPQLSGTPTLTSDTTSIMVSWTHPQFLPDNYTVSYSCQLLCDSQSLPVKTNTGTGTANNHTISSLKAGSNCTVSVTAAFVDGNSNTITSSSNTSTAAPTHAPEELNSTSVESRSLSVVWGIVPCMHQGGPITGYTLRYSNGTSIVNTTGEGSRQHVLTGLTPFTNYSVEVAAINDGGTGLYSDPALTVETLQDVPGTVVNLTVYTSVTELTLSWSPPLELNGVIIVYEVCSDSEMLSCTNTSATNDTLMNIPPETFVSIAVTAYSIIGPGENVTVAGFTESVPIVSNVSATPLNSTSVMVSWTPVKLTVAYYYTVNYTTMGVVNGTVTFPDTVTSGVVSGLQGGQQYQFSVTVTLNISGELYIGSHNTLQPMITLPLPPVPSSTLLISSSKATTFLDVTASISLANAIPSSSFSSSSLLPSSTSKTSPVNSTSPLPAAVTIVVLLILTIIVAVVIIIIIVIIRKRKQPKSFAVHYLKEGPKVDQTVGSEQLYVTVASKPFFEEFPDDDSVIEGKKVLLPVKVIGSPQPNLTWYHEKTRLGNDYAYEISSGGSLTIITAEMRHSGTYRLVATNSEGTVEKQFSLKVITEEDEEPPLATAAEVIKSRPVPVAEFGQYVSQNHANGNKGFSSLYTSLQSGESDHPVTVSLDPANKPLNRFNNITVYDDNRIVLKPLVDCQNDYINASYVDGYESFHKFIACQGPLKKTLTDFWRMIWQENVHTIAMVTNLKENNKIKCQQYWPDNGSKNFGPFIVTTTDQLMCADYIVRLLQVELTEGSNFPRMITQYHFTSWPDHDVPEYATSILAYHRRIKKDYNPSQGPIVVHCSAGVGRTGTLIAIDTLLEQVEKAKMVDVCGVITKMRHQRMKMVQTTNQFAFIHDVILESVTCGDTQINSGDLRFTIAQMRTKQKESGKTGFEIQFEILNQVTPNPSEVKVLTATQNKNMNRSMKFLPPDKHRVQLKGVLPDYIHATFVNGYKHKKAFIVAQNPMESTTKDFWKMVRESECTVVVMLCGLEENGQEVFHQYWPSTGIQNYGDLLVGTTQENKCDGYTERVLSITDQSGKTQHQVTQFHIRNWNPQGKCSNPQTIITVMEEIYKVQRRTDNKPIVVHCSDTVSRAGMFCAIATTIDRCKTESVVDVFQVVKAQRIQKPGLVLTVEQYQFVFEAVLTFLESFETYSNFK